MYAIQKYLGPHKLCDIFNPGQHNSSQLQNQELNIHECFEIMLSGVPKIYNSETIAQDLLTDLK